MSKRRGAVVIGVNKTGGLPALESSADGAVAVAKWLTSEGFEVKTITDAAGPVTPQQIASAIGVFVRAGSYHQLVIYFSGHGYWKNEAELWLLTDAPVDANAAVSWAETAEYAKDCGIPNVVLISDACRSIPGTPRELKVRGSIVFPNEDVQRSRAKVDKFMAAATGTQAFEVPIGAEGKKENAFTHCFLRAFKSPDRDMIREVNENGALVKVVPNRKLEKYLRRELAALLASINVQVEQTPDAEVLSDDDVYIGRAQTDPAATEPLAQAPPVVHLRDVAAVAVGRAFDQPSHVPPDEMLAIERLAKESGFSDAVKQAKTVADVRHFETETGFAVLGTAVMRAVAASGGLGMVLSSGDGSNPGVVRITPDQSACTVALQFASGHGTALAALRGFIGHVLVEADHVTNVSYVPSDNSWRWPDYESRRERIDRLRAAAAAAVRHGVFRLDDKQAAAELAEHIRVAKGLDPALGLYAAYAYSEADRRTEIDSVLDYMRSDLQADLFDVAMLARQLTGRASYAPSIVPFCPMLTQGWNLLRVRGARLPKVLEDAQDELEPALWTTFKPARAQLIFEAILAGGLR